MMPLSVKDTDILRRTSGVAAGVLGGRDRYYARPPKCPKRGIMTTLDGLIKHMQNTALEYFLVEKKHGRTATHCEVTIDLGQMNRCFEVTIQFVYATEQINAEESRTVVCVSPESDDRLRYLERQLTMYLN